jgi:alpha-galactosidase
MLSQPQVLLQLDINMVCFCRILYIQIIIFLRLFKVNMDDCWQVSRDAQGTIQADPKAFPSGIPALIDYVHSRKLKFGLYSGRYVTLDLSIHYIVIVFLDTSDRGNATCAGRPGTLGYETKDANTYADWGVDYLKLDSCNTNGTPAAVEYSIMRDALNATGRPIFFSLCGIYRNY